MIEKKRGKTTSLFILIKEYVDTAHFPSVSYIGTTEKIDSDCFFSFFTEYIEIARYFRYERCERYYDSENLKGALYPYQTLETEYKEQDNEYPNVGDTMLTLLNEQGFIDWREQSIKTGEQYFWNQEEVTNDTLGEMARNKALGNPAILLNGEAIKWKSPIQVISSSHETIDIEHCNDIPSLHEWFSDNRQPQRVYDYNPKHGDDKHPSQAISGTNKKAAQLMTNREDTEKLLRRAIGTDQNSSLWYYDETHGKHIYFENQNEKIRCAFHGYHLSEGEENYDNIDLDKLESVLCKHSK